MKRLMLVIVAICLGSIAGCGDIECDSDADCAGGEVCAEAGGVLFSSRVCVAASDVVSNNATPDMASDLSISDMASDMDGVNPRDDLGMSGDMTIDAQSMDMSDPDMPCAPRSSQQICSDIGAECGSPMVDECGATITVNCGQCANSDVCQENECVCVPESNEDFCSRFGADCGMVTNLDNCGDSRTVDCGTCSGNEQCGEQAPNVCGCPCDIAGTCYPDGAANPANPCEVCDSQRSTTQWSVESGKSCSDRDLCTENDLCQPNGTCQGDSVMCVSGSSCRTASCDPGTGACIETDQPNGMACPGSGPDCVSHTCQSGTCQTRVNSGTCLINGTCYNDTERNPSRICEWCDSSESTSNWSNATNQQCNSDGLNCTIDICNSSGQCTHLLQAGYCRIDDTCYSDGTRNPNAECEWCDSSAFPSAWVFTPPGESCSSDGVACTEDVCDGSGACVHPVASNKCYVNNTCYNSGDSSNFNCCRGCDPNQSRTSFSPINDGMTCSFNCGGGPGICQNGGCTDGFNLCIPDACPL